MIFRVSVALRPVEITALTFFFFLFFIAASRQQIFPLEPIVEYLTRIVAKVIHTDP